MVRAPRFRGLVPSQILAEHAAEGLKGIAERAPGALRMVVQVLERVVDDDDPATKRSQLLGARGRSPENEGTLKGEVHHHWTFARLALGGRSDRVVLEECIRGEKTAKASYEAALCRVPLISLPEEMRPMRGREYQRR